MRILALLVLIAGAIVIEAGFTAPDVPFEEHDKVRDYVTLGLFAAAVAVLRLRPLRMLASLGLALAGFAVWFGFV
jgi:hypothetical protein